MTKPSAVLSAAQVCLLCMFVLPVHSEFNPEVFCTLIANNTKIKDPSACNKFITCVDQKPVTSVCEGDLFYDRNLQSCVDPATVKCYSSNPCAAHPKVNGFVPDPYTCNSYYYCRNGEGILGHCSDGMNFDPTTNICIRNHHCEEKIMPEDYCNIVPDDIFVKVPGSCVSYQVCWLGRLINGSCPEGSYFNAFNGECDYFQVDGCKVNNSLAPTIPPSGVKCHQPDVFVSDGVSCNGYYYCKGFGNGNIELIHGVCPSPTFFNDSNGGACVSRVKTACKFNRCLNLGYKGIQMANINDDGCTGFLICEYGEIIGQQKCPQDMYFNELLQHCTPKKVYFPACKRHNNTTQE